MWVDPTAYERPRRKSRAKKYRKPNPHDYTVEDKCRLRMMLLHNFTGKEIALRLGRSVSSVGVHLHRNGQSLLVARAAYMRWFKGEPIQSASGDEPRSLRMRLNRTPKSEE